MRKGLIVSLILLAGCGRGGDHLSLPNPDEPLPTCTAVVDWEIPDTFINGEQLRKSDLEKLTIYINEESGMDKALITRVEELTDVYLIQWTITNLPIGEHWFYMTIETEDEVSAYSNELSKICS